MRLWAVNFLPKKASSQIWQGPKHAFGLPYLPFVCSSGIQHISPLHTPRTYKRTITGKKLSLIKIWSSEAGIYFRMIFAPLKRPLFQKSKNLQKGVGFVNSKVNALKRTWHLKLRTDLEFSVECWKIEIKRFDFGNSNNYSNLQVYKGHNSWYMQMPLPLCKNF